MVDIKYKIKFDLKKSSHPTLQDVTDRKVGNCCVGQSTTIYTTLLPT